MHGSNTPWPSSPPYMNISSSPNSSISTDSSDVAIISVLGEAPHIQGFQTATISVADCAVLQDMRVATPPSMFPKLATTPEATRLRVKCVSGDLRSSTAIISVMTSTLTQQSSLAMAGYARAM